MSMFTNVQRQKEYGDAYHIIFNRVEGVEEGCQVYYSGHLVGRVRRLELRPSDHRVDVTIALTPRLFGGKVELTRESHYRVEGRMFGRRWLVIQYEPGEVVPPNGEVAGESVARFDRMLNRGTAGIEKIRQQVRTFKELSGDPKELRHKVLAGVKLFNDLSFDIRAQVNNFNKFSGLAEGQLDVLTKKVEESTQRARIKSARLVQMLRYYVAFSRARLEAGDHATSAQVRDLQEKIRLANQLVAQVQHVAQEQKRVMERLGVWRKKAEEYQATAEAIRLYSSHPELLGQVRGGLRGLRDKVRRLKAELKSSQGRLLDAPAMRVQDAPVVRVPEKMFEAIPGAAPAWPSASRP